jgi:hypothetical protein
MARRKRKINEKRVEYNVFKNVHACGRNDREKKMQALERYLDKSSSIPKYPIPSLYLIIFFRLTKSMHALLPALHPSHTDRVHRERKSAQASYSKII